MAKRNKAISKGLHRYWRAVHAISDLRDVSASEARNLYRFAAENRGEPVTANFVKEHPRLIPKPRKREGGAVFPKPPEREGESHYYMVAFSYKKSGRTFDIVTIARSEDQAIRNADKFLANDERGKRIVRSHYDGFTITPAVDKTRPVDHRVGFTRYRNSK